MPLFSKVFKNKDANKKSVNSNTNGIASSKPQWVDSWLRTRVDPEEVAELLHGCTVELKSRALDVPFLLLPFRPSSDPSAAKTFIRNYFIPPNDRPKLKNETLINELRMTEAMVLISVMKWCWARLPGGVVSWDTYKMFRVGEKDSKYARDSFTTFMPISVDSKARAKIINDFFDLLAALAAHGKSNGLGGHKLSRYAGWWAFEHYDTGKGFETGYKAWSAAADATCHLFFAYLRAMSPEPGKTNGILDLPRSLQLLVATTDYPPLSGLLSNNTTKVVMVVDVVSPTPYALLRRAKNFEYRDDDRALRQFADYDDPVDALTGECRRVLRAISSTNQSQVSDSKISTSLVDSSWSRFEDVGFSSTLDDIGEDEKEGLFSFSTTGSQVLGSGGRSPVLDLNRPTTPSWADFLSSGFTDENGNRTAAPILLPPDKMLPPIDTEPRGQSSQSYRRPFDTSYSLEPGELASITKINIDDSFWWVWISSLAGEEPTSRKACFGRCALIETDIPGGQWMVMEEQVKGAAPAPVQGAYIAEKKGFLGFTTKRGRLTRRRSNAKKGPLSPNGLSKPEPDPTTTSILAPDQQAKIHMAAMALANRKKAEETVKAGHNRKGRFDDPESRNNSIFTLGAHIKDEASPALQWATQYDKKTVRAQYLGNQLAGKGSKEFLTLPTNGLSPQKSNSTLYESVKEKDLPTVPVNEFDSHPYSPSRYSADFQVSPIATVHPVVSSVPEPITKSEKPLQMNTIEPVPQPAHPLSAQPTLAQATPAVKSEQSRENVTPVPLPTAAIDTTSKALPEVRESSNTIGLLPTTPSNKDEPSPSDQTNTMSTQQASPVAQRTTGIKRLFGTMRKTRDESTAPPPAPQANPAVAAARRALESKLNPPKPEPVQNNFAKYKGIRGPLAVAAAVTTVPEPEPVPISGPVPVSQPHVVLAAELSGSEPTTTIAPTVKTLEPALAIVPTSHQSPKVSRDAEFDQLSLVGTSHQPPKISRDAEFDQLSRVDTSYQPPKISRDAEYDQLSRVDTSEREQADHEFSRFDQGPLLDQPAALPTDFSHNQDDFNEKHELAIKHQSVYSAVTMDPEIDTSSDEDEQEKPELTQEISANDRWAQIRRNAAERAARFSEDHGNRSRTETRTDDGETSGEETIESRVARIKARVAELTGNMEGIRR